MFYFLIFIVPTIILGIWAQSKLMTTYKKYVRVPSRSGLTGREVAEYVMRKGGVSDVKIVPIRGQLTDHYDPINKRLCLSQDHYAGTSLAALGVAAHEAGHAIQDEVKYPMLRLRMGLAPVTQISSQVLPFAIIGGLFFNILGLIWLGVAVYAVLTIFQLVTLPVEFDASKRAKAELAGLGIISQEEMPGVARTLDAAALTYVAAFVAALGNLLYLLMIALARR